VSPPVNHALSGRQGIKQRAPENFPDIARTHSIGKDALHRAEISNLGTDIREMAGCDIANFSTRVPVLLAGKCQQCPHFVETET
jgi:hypothetical protein